MTTTDPRARLDEIKARAEKDQTCYRCRLTKQEHQSGYAAAFCTFIFNPHTDSQKADMAAALTAVLDLHARTHTWHAFNGDDIQCEHCRHHAPCPTVTKIQEALDGIA